MTTPWSKRTIQLERRWQDWGPEYFRRAVTDSLKELCYGAWILDVGCGAGVLYSQLPKKLQRCYVGVDFTPEFIQLCKKRYPEAQWKLGNILDLPFPDDSYDIVNTTNELQHVENWKKAASELVRVSNKYVVNCARIHNKPTAIMPVKPFSVLPRYFNPPDLVDFYKKHGQVRWRRVKASRGLPILGLFVTQLRGDGL